MIVLIRGTSGAGKTYIAEQVISDLGGLHTADQHLHIPDLMGREKLAGYVWSGAGVALLGRYNVACGGCDGISWRGAADQLEQLAAEQSAAGRRVLLEGLIVATWGQPRLSRLRRHGLHVIHLTTPLNVCLASVNARRRERLGELYTPVKPDNTVAKFNTLRKTTENNQLASIAVEKLARGEALARVRQLVLGEERV